MHYAKIKNAKVILFCVKIEEKLFSLENEDKDKMLEALGIS